MDQPSLPRTAGVEAAAEPRPDDTLTEVIDHVKPKLRGVLHLAMAPLALAAGVVLIALAPTSTGVLGGAVFLAASVLLFGTSGLYHRRTWGPRGEAVMRRLDHANIYVFIAASYTPMGLLMLHGTSRVLLLSLIWASALGGLTFRLLWLSAPRWLYTLLYIAMGWAAMAWLPAFYRSGGLSIVVLILAGGLCYTIGALVYARRRPDPWPAWFGFHEIFHAGTIGGFSCHYIAISLLTYAAS